MKISPIMKRQKTHISKSLILKMLALVIIFLFLSDGVGFAKQKKTVQDPVIDIPDGNFLAALIAKGVDTNGEGFHKWSPIVLGLGLNESKII